MCRLTKTNKDGLKQSHILSHSLEGFSTALKSADVFTIPQL